ncbi:SMP-30/gluconolactonase/LRE family protein [Paenibacillus naphthalenovorans]|uniref:SMP-30/gluconolaconase/LRE domain-containing protein n=1 Tax=Paenibacillus naphthalenovorans TaxID=162209 RepID=A0A0U2W978_9BACL|nr:SMP-30/gluconolactonase/LRE family protein [Paenibacillus naphthalenovorans]ALS23006.1 SMP-30/gluconolaconase/LRE domain-containing protein [Paenibacillus naphthalenovorans]GCL71933.1 SMP-30/gluconolactonase/LRE family protein [Paenibacillus naphthalenovorans]SDI42933.1 Sugar lactone lactonase YvrE [Paenibacillus naphthalenovorans]
MTECSLVLDAKADLGEGAIWDAEKQVLYWVDITGKTLHVFDPEHHTDRSIPIGQFVGTVVPREAGGVMLALQNGFYSLDLETEVLTPVMDPEQNQPENRFNDGKCDPAGRFWAGTMNLNETGRSGALYCLDTDLNVRKMLTGIGISNGIVWSLDCRTMYYIDSPTKQVVAFDYEMSSGTLSRQRVMIDLTLDHALPDGMTIDAEGMIWIAHWGGYRVTRWNPDNGKQLDEIRVPASQVTSCAFGGKDLDVLYITTARHGLHERELDKQPLAGGIFSVAAQVKGLPAFSFKG